MELKTYQKKAIDDLEHYLTLLNETGNLKKAWQRFWEYKNVTVGAGGLPDYQDILPGVPNLCLKVPTGGGKTFLACSAIRPIFDGLPATKIHAVVWLVPSDAILTQTLAALKNPEHPYRQKINADFGNRVEIYTKQDLLIGHNFNITSLTEQLSIMVLSYDSFRGRREALKARQENGNLAEVAKALGTPENPIENTDETALLQVINQLSPVVIVDESHHACSKLSKEMLKDFNPDFVLDLTATPPKESNILVYVDAVQLKREHMVKLPVIVYNRNDQQEVLADAIDLRNRLEQYAEEEHENGGRYIRPIVLLQAQPRSGTEAVTFEKLREKLVEMGIPTDQIAIKTADINELKDVDLLSKECPIRYIITVNALKEGWDCPFAYILAALANRSSQVEVEQVVGRILRQPYTLQHKYAPLNMSYVLTSSADFRATLDVIVRGLRGCGFSERDCRSEDTAEIQERRDTYTEKDYDQMTLGQMQRNSEFEIEEFQNDEKYLTDAGKSDENTNDNCGVENGYPEKESHDGMDRSISTTAGTRDAQSDENTTMGGKATSEDNNMMGGKITAEDEEEINDKFARDSVTAMLEDARREQAVMESSMAGQSEDPFAGESSEVRDKMKHFRMQEEFWDEAEHVRIPQFYLVVKNSFFTEGYTVKLEKEHLAENFRLAGKGFPENFQFLNEEIARVDIQSQDGNVPKAFRMSEADQRYFLEQFSAYSQEKKVRYCKDLVHKQLDRMNTIETEELYDYADRIVDHMDHQTLLAFVKMPQRFGGYIKKYVEELLSEHCEKQFFWGLDTGKIICKPSYKLPSSISPLRSTNTFGKSLYQAEQEVNNFESKMVMALTGMDHVKWWHRNIKGQGLCLNGFIYHYPDFIVMTKSGILLLLETKGEFLSKEDALKRLKIGRAWEKQAGKDQFRYYMIFEKEGLKEEENSFSFERFLQLMGNI